MGRLFLLMPRTGEETMKKEGAGFEPAILGFGVKHVRHEDFSSSQIPPPHHITQYNAYLVLVTPIVVGLKKVSTPLNVIFA